MFRGTKYKSLRQITFRKRSKKKIVKEVELTSNMTKRLRQNAHSYIECEMQGTLSLREINYLAGEYLSLYFY